MEGPGSDDGPARNGNARSAAIAREKKKKTGSEGGGGGRVLVVTPSPSDSRMGDSQSVLDLTLWPASSEGPRAACLPPSSLPTPPAVPDLSSWCILSAYGLVSAPGPAGPGQ